MIVVIDVTLVDEPKTKTWPNHHNNVTVVQ